MKVGAVILAAGASARFGQPKQLLQFRGQSFVRRAAAAALEAGCAPVAIVLGPGSERIQTELSAFPIKFLPNENWQAGIGASIRCGVEALKRCEAIAILTCDQPYVDGEVIRRLIHAQQQTGKPIAACAYSETRGIPALFHRTRFAGLLSLGDKEGAKSLIAAQPNEVALVDFPEGAIDIDHAADYERLLASPIQGHLLR